MKRRLFVILLAGMYLFLTGCSREPSFERYEDQFLGVFDTVTRIVGYETNADTFSAYAQRFRAELEEYHQLYDIYNEYDGINNLKTINDNAGVIPIKVDQRIIDLLDMTLEMYELTDGKINVAMGSVLRIWHRYREFGMSNPQMAQLPSMEELAEAAQHTDIYQIIIDRQESTVFLQDPEMSLDVGGIAKGYATEQVCQHLKDAGLSHAMVSVGGNVHAIGSKPDGTPWIVGLQNPDSESDPPYLHKLNIRDISVVTSGSYQRYFIVDGVPYHHIIHPELLAPWRQYVLVTILCKDAGIADALSTAVFNMEPEDGLDFIERMEGIEAFWLYPDGTEAFSSGFLQYLEDE